MPLAVVVPTMNCAVKKALQSDSIDWETVPIIMPEHGVARKRFEQWFRQKHAARPNVYAQVSGQEALVSMVALGFGIGLSPIVVADNSPVKDLVDLLPDTQIQPFDLGLCCFKRNLGIPLWPHFCPWHPMSRLNSLPLH